MNIVVDNDAPFTLLKVTYRVGSLHIMPATFNRSNPTSRDPFPATHACRLDSIMVVACASIVGLLIKILKEGLEFVLFYKESRPVVESGISSIV